MALAQLGHVLLELSRGRPEIPYLLIGGVSYAFDLLHLGSASHLKRPLRDRRAALADLPIASPLLLSQPLPGTGRIQTPHTRRDMKTLRWVGPRIIVEVAFTEWTEGGNLRHASFVGFRHDKSAHNVRRQP